MDNRYNHFADGDVRSAERLANEARDSAKQARLQWQEKMEKQLVEDVIAIVAEMRTENDNKVRDFKMTSVLRMLVHEFSSGILYAQEKID